MQTRPDPDEEPEVTKSAVFPLKTQPGVTKPGVRKGPTALELGDAH